MLGKDNGEGADEGGVEAFLMGAGRMRESEEYDDTKSQRSAVNLNPFKKDIGNRFSMIQPDTRESWFAANPLARSAASTFKASSNIYDDLDESKDSVPQVSGGI